MKRKFPVLLVIAFVLPAVSMAGLSVAPRPGFALIGPGFFTRTLPPDYDGSTSSSSLSSSSSDSSFSGDYFYSERYGPFSLNNPSDVTASFTYGLNSISSQNVIERMRVYLGSTVVSATSNATIYYEKGTKKTVTFALPLRNYWTASGLTIKIEILNSSSFNVLKTFTSEFNPPSCSYIQPHDLKAGLYTSKSLGFYGDGENMHEIHESFDFTSIGDYLDVDYYYRLDVSKNQFSYPNDNSNLSYKSINLSFNDSENMFPSMTHDN